jgi:hypothetical protein
MDAIWERPWIAAALTRENLEPFEFGNISEVVSGAQEKVQGCPVTITGG